MSIQQSINSVIDTMYDVKMRNADLKAKQQIANQKAQDVKEAKEFQMENFTHYKEQEDS